MSTPEILNLDELDNGTMPAFVHKQVTYVMHEMTVKDYITAVSASKTAAKAEVDGSDPSSVIDALVDTISIAFPELPKEEIMSMSMPKVTAIMELVMKHAAENSEGTEVKK